MKKEIKPMTPLSVKKTGRKPEYKCDNCGCMRWNPCKCKKKNK